MCYPAVAWSGLPRRWVAVRTSMISARNLKPGQALPEYGPAGRESPSGIVIFVTCVNDDLDIRFCCMQKADTLIRTKLRLPFTRTELVARPRLQEQLGQGLRGPLTLITAPAGFGKTTLVADFIAGLRWKVESSTHQGPTLRKAQGRLFSK